MREERLEHSTEQSTHDSAAGRTENETAGSGFGRGVTEAFQLDLPENPERRGPHPWKGRPLLGRYRFTGQKLGSGGMGDVFLARDENLGINVVIKVPKIAELGGQKGVERFRREIQSLLTLTHPHVVKIEAVGVEEGIPFAVMQYLEGGSLHERRHSLHRQPNSGSTFFEPLGLPAVGRWLQQVADALDFIHRNNYVHRDVKPGNILFDKSDNAFLGDFGVAKAVHSAQQETAGDDLTTAGTVPGTHAYFAPELLLHLAEPTPASDQYALATTVFDLLTGRKPFVGGTPQEVLHSRRTFPAPDVRFLYRSLPEPVAAALARGLAMDPHERFPSCKDFADAVVGGVGTSGGDHHAAVAAKLACPRCNRLLEITRELTRDGFVCPNCSGLLIAQPDLLWVEPVEDSQMQNRLAELDGMRRRGPPPVPGPPPSKADSWLDDGSPPTPSTPSVPTWDIEPHAPTIDTGKAETKRRRREYEKQHKRKQNRQELLGMLSFMAMAAFLLFLALSSCRMR